MLPYQEILFQMIGFFKYFVSLPGEIDRVE